MTENEKLARKILARLLVFPSNDNQPIAIATEEWFTNWTKSEMLMEITKILEREKVPANETIIVTKPLRLKPGAVLKNVTFKSEREKEKR